MQPQVTHTDQTMILIDLFKEFQQLARNKSQNSHAFLSLTSTLIPNGEYSPLFTEEQIQITIESASQYNHRYKQYRLFYKIFPQYQQRLALLWQIRLKNRLEELSN